MNEDTGYGNETTITSDSEPLEEEELLLELVRSIVRKPEKVSIDVAKGKTATLLTITVDPEDRGHVIGKNRQTFKAIVHLFAKSAFLDNRRVMIQLEGQDFKENYHRRDGGGNYHRNNDRYPRRDGPVREYRNNR